MADDQPTPEASKPKGPIAWLSNRAGLIILVVLAAIVGLKLMSSWIKWLLIAMVIGAVVYLIKGALARTDADEPGRNDGD